MSGGLAMRLGDALAHSRRLLFLSPTQSSPQSREDALFLAQSFVFKLPAGEEMAGDLLLSPADSKRSAISRSGPSHKTTIRLVTLTLRPFRRRPASSLSR